MAKRIAVIAQRHATSQFLAMHLQPLVGGDVEVVSHSFERGLDRLEVDVAVISTTHVTGQEVGHSGLKLTEARFATGWKSSPPADWWPCGRGRPRP